MELAWSLLDSAPPFETSEATRAKNNPEQKAHYDWVLNREKARARWVVASLVMKGKTVQEAVDMYRNQRDKAKTLSGWTDVAGPESHFRLSRKSWNISLPGNLDKISEKVRRVGDRRTVRVLHTTALQGYGDQTIKHDYLAVNVGGQTLLLDPHAGTWADLRYWERKPVTGSDGSPMRVVGDEFRAWTGNERNRR